MSHLIGRLTVTGLLSFFLSIFQWASAQNITIKGIIKDTAGKPVQYANVLLLKSSDSSLVKGTISDASGKYSFENINQGEYLAKISFTGMEQMFTKSFAIASNKNEIDQGIIYLRHTDAQLQDVTITGKKPLFEQKIDRTIINVRNSITSAGGTALDVLSKSPGVTVNRQDNSIAIDGKTGVSVMINGKINYMPMDALIQLLESISAGNIEKIELITAPPSKYDANGNGGFINIVLINNPYAGFSGSYFLSAGHGEKLLGGAGFNFNYRRAKVNLYGSYDFNHIHTNQQSRSLTQFTKDGNLISTTSFSDRDAIRQIQNMRIGIDYQFDDNKTILGALVSGYLSHWSMVANNGSTISRNNIVDTIITATDDPEWNDWQNIMANLNVQHTFKPGSVLFFDANYIYYKDDNPNTYYNAYYNKSRELLSRENLKNGKVTPIHFKVFSSDYTTPLSKKITMEAGAKISFSTFSNDVYLNKLKEGIWVADTGFTANYLLKEQIEAAYTSFTFNPNSTITITAGLRYEYTSSNLGTAKIPNIIDRKYGELFPTFFVSKKIDADNAINFSYSRRITRPTFNDLAPFTIFFDPKTFYSGNPALQPAISNTLQASYIFKNYSVAVSYTHENNTIDNFYFQTQRLDTLANVLYLSARNFKYEQYLTAAFSLPFTITRWWSMQNNINLNWRRISTAYDNTPAILENFNYNLNSTQRFTLPKDFSFEATGLYSSASYLGTAKRKPYYQLDAGIQKKLSNKKDILRLTATDIFNSGNNCVFEENLPIKNAIVNRSFNFRTVAYRITYTHNFGNKALKGKRERSTGAEEELRRVNN